MSWSLGISDTSEVNLEQGKSICLKSDTSYNSLCTSNEWNITGWGCVNYCWNCGGPHGLERCKEPKYHNNIYYNRRKYTDDKEKNGDGGSGRY